MRPGTRTRLVRRRPLLGTRAAIVAISLLILAPTDGPSVSLVSGSVEIESGDPPVWKTASAGDALGNADAIRTGSDASAELRLGTRTVRLYPGSSLRLALGGVDPSGPRSVRLEYGRALFEVRDGRNDPRFELRAGEMVVEARDARLLAETTPAATTSVAVFRGSVGVRRLLDAVDGATRVRPGFAAVGAADHALELVLSHFQDPWHHFPRIGATTRSVPAAPDAAPPTARQPEPVPPPTDPPAAVSAAP